MWKIIKRSNHNIFYVPAIITLVLSYLTRVTELSPVMELRLVKENSHSKATGRLLRYINME